MAMEITNAMGTAVNGVKRGLEDLERNAAEVAQASKGDGADVAVPLVKSKLSQQQVETNVAMIKTMDEVLGTLLDEKA